MSNEHVDGYFLVPITEMWIAEQQVVQCYVSEEILYDMMQNFKNDWANYSVAAAFIKNIFKYGHFTEKRLIKKSIVKDGQLTYRHYRAEIRYQNEHYNSKFTISMSDPESGQLYVNGIIIDNMICGKIEG